MTYVPFYLCLVYKRVLPRHFTDSLLLCIKTLVVAKNYSFQYSSPYLKFFLTCFQISHFRQRLSHARLHHISSSRNRAACQPQQLFSIDMFGRSMYCTVVSSPGGVFHALRYNLRTMRNERCRATVCIIFITFYKLWKATHYHSAEGFTRSPLFVFLSLPHFCPFPLAALVILLVYKTYILY